MLHDAGELVVENEEKLRGGTAERCRYVVDGDASHPAPPRDVEDETTWQHSLTPAER